MKRSPRVIALSLLGAAALVAASGAASAAPARPGGNGAAPAVHTTSASVDAAQHWTAARMRAAEPLDLLNVSRSAVSKATETVRGLARKVGPTSPLADSTGAEWTQGGDVEHTAGRVFFTFQGQDASCSGDAVTSQNASVVVTAGHCVKYQGSWHTNWVFVPGYHDGQRPYGTWAAESLLTTPQWEASEDLNYDVGMAVVNPQDGKNLTDVVGGQGIAFNQPRGQAMYAFGYPAEAPYDGEKLIYCNGTAFDEPLGLSNDQGLNCTQTGGASGGPWFQEFDASTGKGVQNSVNSFKYSFYPGWMFGPYFGDDASDLYQRAQTS